MHLSPYFSSFPPLGTFLHHRLVHKTCEIAPDGIRYPQPLALMRER